MAQIRFANNVSTQLTKPVAADDSTIEVRSLTHGLVWPNISATGDYFLIVIDDIESSYWEILKCTKVSIADNITTLTVERGLEGTVPSEFQAGSVVENRLTAGTLDAFGAGFPVKVEINRGGTGATTAADARTNLDVPSKADLSSEVNTRTSEIARLDQKITDNIPPAATTSVRGTVILSSAIDSVSETMAATPKAVKVAYDDLDNKILNIPDADNKTIIEKDGKVITQDVAIAGNIADLASFRGQIGNANDITKYFSTNDLNDVKKSGFWYYGTQCLNTPGDVKTSGIVHVLQYGGMTYQYAHTYYPQNIYVRSFSSEVWNDWRKIILSNNKATLSTQGITQLNSAVNSVSETLAATPKAVKTAYDKAVAAAAKSASADKLTTARSITLTGPVTGTVDFDGSADVSLATTVTSATTSSAGIVQLNNTVTSTSTTQAATASAVKTAYDKAVDAADAVSSIQAFEVGELRVSFADSLEGCLLCDGSKVSRTTYSALFSVIGTTFGAGNGSTTFTLPNYVGRTIQGASSGTVGTSVQAGLPNVSGQFWAYVVGWGNANGNGPFYNAGAGPEQGTNGGAGGTCCKWGFDMSRVNRIYGKSTTVQPPAIVANIFIKY